MARDRRGSEFGGSPGRIQPPPHNPDDSSIETLGRIYATEPAPLPIVIAPTVKPPLPGVRLDDDPQTTTPPSTRKR
jgi:hypothetical protein